MTMCPVFPDHQKCYFKEVFQNKTIILTLRLTGLQRCIKFRLLDIEISSGHFFNALLVFHG